jgi:hypothetical protein
MLRRAVIAGCLILSSGCLYTVTWLADGSGIACYEAGGVWLVNLKGEKRMIFAAPDLVNVYLIAAPKGDRIALTGTLGENSPAAVFTEGGKVLWTQTLTGKGWGILPWFWSADGKSVLLQGDEPQRLALVPAGAKKIRELKIAGEIPRFSADGDILCLRVRPGGTAYLDRYDVKGKLKKSLPWTYPAGYAEAEPQLLSADGDKAWFRVKTGTKTVLADRTGRIIREFFGEPEAPGTDFPCAVTRKNGYTLADGSTGTETSLNGFYNRFLHSELSAFINDPAHANGKFNPDDVNFFPVFSPDGKAFALHGTNRLYLADLSTGAMRTLASW